MGPTGFHDARCWWKLFFFRTPAFRAARIACWSALCVDARELDPLALLNALTPLSVRACTANEFSTGERSAGRGEGGMPLRRSGEDAARGGDEWMNAPGIVGDGVRDGGGEVGADDGPDGKKDEVGVWLVGEGGDGRSAGTRFAGSVRGNAPRKSPGSSVGLRVTSASSVGDTTGGRGAGVTSFKASCLSNLASVTSQDARLELHCVAYWLTSDRNTNELRIIVPLRRLTRYRARG